MSYVGSSPIVVHGRPLYARYTQAGAVEIHYEAGRDSEVAFVPPFGEVEETYKYLCSVEGDRFSLTATGLTVGSHVINAVARVDMLPIYHLYWRQK